MINTYFWKTEALWVSNSKFTWMITKSNFAFKTRWKMHFAENQYLWILEFSIFYYVSKKSQFNILAFSSSLVIIFLHVLIEFFQKILLHLANEVLLFSRTSCCRSHLFHLNSRSNLFHFFSKDVHRNYVACCNRFY